MAPDATTTEVANDDETTFADTVDVRTTLPDLTDEDLFDQDVHVLIRTDNLDADLMQTAREHDLAFDDTVDPDYYLDNYDEMLLRFIHEDRQ